MDGTPPPLPAPRWRQLLERGTGAAAHVLLCLAGVSVILFPPSSIAGTVGPALTLVWGLLAASGGLVAVIGAASNRWRVEWMALFATAAGLAIYDATIWALVGETISRLPQALTVAALVGFTLRRIVEYSNLAAQRRLLGGEDAL